MSDPAVLLENERRETRLCSLVSVFRPTAADVSVLLLKEPPSQCVMCGLTCPRAKSAASQCITVTPPLSATLCNHRMASSSKEKNSLLMMKKPHLLLEADLQKTLRDLSCCDTPTPLSCCRYVLLFAMRDTTVSVTQSMTVTQEIRDDQSDDDDDAADAAAAAGPADAQLIVDSYYLSRALFAKCKLISRGSV